jgi:hypothetical protein
MVVTDRIEHPENGVFSIKLARMLHVRFDNQTVLHDAVSCHL